MKQVSSNAAWTTESNDKAQNVKSFKKGQKVMGFLQHMKSFESKFGENEITYAYYVPASIVGKDVFAEEQLASIRCNASLLEQLSKVSDGQLFEIECLGEVPTKTGKHTYVKFKLLRTANNTYKM